MKIMLSWFTVKDMEQSAKFYTETLGLKKVFEMPGWAEFGEAADGPTIGLMQQPDSVEHGATVVLRVADIAAMRARLESQGVQFDGPTREIPGAVKLAAFTDPNGNRLQLAQPLLAS